MQEFHDNFQAISRIVQKEDLKASIFLVQEFHDNFQPGDVDQTVQKEHLNAPYRVRDQTPPLDYGLSHPVEPITIEADHPPETSPAYIAATSLGSKRRGFRRSWTVPINEFNFTWLGVGVGNTGFGAVPYGRPIEDIGTGACIVNRQECMDWKDKFEGEFEEQILLEFSKIRHVYFPVQESHDNSQSAKVVQKEHLNASTVFRLPGDLRQGNKTKDWHWSGVWQNHTWCDALCPITTNGALDFLAT
ncbi:hypothetical protein BHYA_0009g00760 [Botrytis hyacinthi]|uniref:Uncharacterized protein n=1 Tax=Botrytis hyacinthi TaxID=278943 RepID=A0A4Z1HBI6_9HELO|nr:hypothetical protein BHYA_0009g00760 [Botrytis hyacinthi]